MAFRHEKKLSLPREYIAPGFTPMKGRNPERIEAEFRLVLRPAMEICVRNWIVPRRGGEKKSFRERKGDDAQNGSVVEATTWM